MYRRFQFAFVIVAFILFAPLWGQVSASTPETRLSQAKAASHPEVLSDEAYEAVLQFFQYDKQIPLESRVVEREETQGYIREKIVFNGIRNSRVPGYLGLPRTASGPYPCILLMHGIMGSKSRWWEDDSWSHGGLAIKQLLAAGFAVLALDAQYHGERIAANNYENPGAMLFERKWYNRTREMTLQTKVEYRRAIDYLTTRTEIDVERIGLLGHSMGGIIIFALNACEPRIKSSVACVTPLNIWGPKEMAVMSPFNFARGVDKHPFLMLMGRSDAFYSASEVELLMEMIEGSPKELIWYDSGHRLPQEYIAKALQWFERYLK